MKYYSTCYKTTLLYKALNVAIKAHQNQLDKGGKPYIYHVLRVAKQMSTVDEKIVALLHDVYEDNDLSLNKHCKKHFNENIFFAVDCITRRKNETVDSYYSRVKLNPISVSVKIVDLTDNMDLSRLKNVNQKDINRINFYKRMRQKLLEYKNKINV